MKPRQTIKGDFLRLGQRLTPEKIREIKSYGLDPNTNTSEELGEAIRRKEAKDLGLDPDTATPDQIEEAWQKRKAQDLEEPSASG
jgi:hypothetical protein